MEKCVCIAHRSMMECGFVARVVWWRSLSRPYERPHTWSSGLQHGNLMSHQCGRALGCGICALHCNHSSINTTGRARGQVASLMSTAKLYRNKNQEPHRKMRRYLSRSRIQSILTKSRLVLPSPCFAAAFVGDNPKTTNGGATLLSRGLAYLLRCYYPPLPLDILSSHLRTTT